MNEVAENPLFIARQPILDQKERVVAYELLHRSGPENACTAQNLDRASAEVIRDSLLAFGLQSLTCGKMAFVNISRFALARDLPGLLPPRTTVLELLETVTADDEVLAACRELKSAGYKIALDDYVDRPEMAGLAELADVIKVDFLATKPEERRRLADRFGGRTTMLAEKVETREDFQTGVDAGYTWFQGYFFCRPEVVTTRAMAGSRTGILRFLQEVHRPTLDYRALERLIGQEVALSVKLLRFLNSAAFGLGSGVSSIRHGLALLGERNIRRWASLVALSQLAEGRCTEAFSTALVRARFCELAGQAAGVAADASELFLCGILSTLDALLGRSMAECIADMPLSPGLKQALLGDEETAIGAVFALVSSYERGDWQHASRLAAELRLPLTEMAPTYRAAVAWSVALGSP